MQTTSIVAGIVVIIILGLGGWYLVSRGGTSPSTPTNPTASCLPAEKLTMSTTIEYRDNQFFAQGGAASSTTFCVPKGGTVTFTGSNLWVASDPHPIHTDLAGFDALGAKNSYFFTFEKVGTWGFHDHLKATNTGKVIVVE